MRSRSRSQSRLTGDRGKAKPSHLPRRGEPRQIPRRLAQGQGRKTAGRPRHVEFRRSVSGIRQGLPRIRCSGPRAAPASTPRQATHRGRPIGIEFGGADHGRERLTTPVVFRRDSCRQLSSFLLWPNSSLVSSPSMPCPLEPPRRSAGADSAAAGATRESSVSPEHQFLKFPSSFPVRPISATLATSFARSVSFIGENRAA